MARPTKVTQKQEVLCGLLEQGNHREPACRAAGLGVSSFYRYMQRGRVEESGLYHDFRVAVEAAEAAAELRAVATLRGAALTDWRASLSFLERRFPERWQKRQATELSGPGGGPIRSATSHAFELDRLSDQELRTLVELQARACAPEEGSA
jgi:transposase